MLHSGFLRTKNIIQNIFSNHTRKLAYVIECDDWSIKQDGLAIVSALNKQNLLKARITTSSIGLRNKIIHFGSANTFFTKNGWRKPHPSNKIVVTWFHVVPNDPKLLLIKKAQQNIDFIHTSCESTKKTLIEAGVHSEKIVVIPLGVDLDLFTKTTDTSQSAVRNQLGIPLDRLVIGSFQKDGVGWGEGLEPKLIKGPDIFVEVVSKLKHLSPLVLLTGPARGYVKRGLEKHGIEYRHVYIKKFPDLARMYHALDLYLITSRIEGGPKAILESWASGIPVVSTRVGMVPDIATQDGNVLLSESEDVESLTKQAERLVGDQTLHKQLVENGYKEVQKYAWRNVAKQYHKHIYEHCNRDENHQ